MEGYISVLYEKNDSYSVIKKCCKREGFSISKTTVGNIAHESLSLRGKIVLNMYPRRKRNFSNIAKVRSFMVKENPPNQKTVPKSLND